jgi:hypothetical protein
MLSRVALLASALLALTVTVQAQQKAPAAEKPGAAKSAADKPVADKLAAEARGRVVFIVDKSVYPEIKDGLETYAAHIRREFNIVCTPLPDDYYKMKPPAIREILKKEYAQSKPPLVGAIMVGPIPHALKGDPKEILIPSPLFYEDFEAKYDDKNGDGVYQDAEITSDRVHNPTEIWTTWWVPPTMKPEEQGKLLNGFLAKLDRYHKGEITGRDALLWMAGNVGHVETCEGWSVLLKDTMNPAEKPLNQKLRIWCHFGQDEGTFRPNKRKDQFSARDFITAFTLQPWQHAHIIGHGNQRGWYWDTCGVVSAFAGEDKPEAALKMDFSKFNGAAANIVTTSGCSNGNFRGDYIGPNYDRALSNCLLFSPTTCTVAYYGAASPQSTSGDPGFCTEIVECLRADGDSYFADGYKKMRNMDYAWGTQHFFFRGGDEKILTGDPFAKYRDSQPPTAEQAKALQEKIDKAGWTVVPPG